MSGIRGKPPRMYTYRHGRRVLLSMLPSLRKRKKYPRQGERAAPTREQAAAYRLAGQRAAAQNLQALSRPMKPPRRKETAT